MTVKVINLLPKELQRQLLLRKWYRSLVRLSLLSGASFVLVILVFFGVWAYLNAARSTLAKEAEQLKQQSAKQETADLKKQIKAINSQIADYNSLATTVPRWSVLIRRFSALVPAGVQVQTFAVDSVKRQVSIGGFAPTRELVIQLHDNIERDTENFTGINYPLENVSKPANINFTYTFTVKENVLQ